MGSESSKKKKSEEANEEQSTESVNEDQSPESASSPTEENSGKDNEEEKKDASAPQQLLQAAKDGQNNRLHRILTDCYKTSEARKRAVNILDGDRLSPLHHAVRRNHLDAVMVLVDYGADINQKTKQNLTPLHLATKYVRSSPVKFSKKGKKEEEIGGVICYLILNKADCTAKDSYGSTPLHVAAMRNNDHAVEEFLKVLSETKFQSLIKTKDEQGMTPLHVACFHGNESVAMLLMKQKANAYITDKDNRTPMHLACLSGSYKICEAIINKLEEVQKKHREKVFLKTEKFINWTDNTGSTALENAVHSDKVELVNFCFQYGAKVRTRDAAERLIRKPSQSVVEKEIVEKLTKELTLKREVMYIAATHGRHEIIALLRQTGEETHREGLCFEDDDLRTPLLVAARNGHLKTFQYLLGFEKDITKRDKYGKTALFLATEHNHINVVKEILKHLDQQKREEQARNAESVGLDNPDSANVVVVEKSGNGSHEVKTLGEKENEQQASTADLTTAQQGKDERKATKELGKENVKAGKSVKNEELTPKGKPGPGKVTSNPQDESVTNTEAGKSSPAANKRNILSKLFSRGGNKDKSGSKEKDSILDKQTQETINVLNHPDNYDNTPLHIASKKGHKEIVEELIDAGAELSSQNFEENIPLHFAAANGHDEIVRTLTNNYKPTQSQRNEEEVLADNHKPEQRSEEEETDCINARNDKMNLPLHLTDYINAKNDKMNTPLHLAALGGHCEIVKYLIKKKANKMARNEVEWTPLDCAASKGRIETVNLLLKNESIVDPLDKTKNTPLHLASANGHSEVVKTLLEKGADINKCNMDGKNCLDLAIDNNHKETALVIIRNEKWRQAMRNLIRDKDSDTFETPMRKMIKKMPDVATEVLNKCIEQNKKDRTDIGYSITFDFSFIDDTFCDFMKSTGTKNGNLKEREKEKQIQNAAEEKPYTSNALILKANHPLTLMVKYEQSSLIGHPIVKSLIRHKWNTYSRQVYYSGMMIYLLFVLLLTGYLLSTPPPYYFREDNGTTVWYANGEDKYGQEADNYIRPNFTMLCKWLVYSLGLLGVLKEIFQASIRRRDYLSFENIMEWFIYLFSVLFVFDFTSEQRLTGLRYSWQWCFGAFAIFFAWMEMIIFIRKVAYVGTFVVMFTDMLKTFGRFSLILFLFLLAFSLSFYSLLMNQSTFSSFGYALMKTFVMLTGEFEYDDIFHGIGYLDKDEFDEESHDYFEEMVWYEGVTYIIFSIFIVIAAILIMNLLIGLAVDDIKGVQEKAELKKHALQIEFALDVEQMFPLRTRKKYFRRTTKIYPNVQHKSWLRSMFPDIGMESSTSAQAIAKSLNPDKTITETKLEQLGKNVTDIQTITETKLEQLGKNVTDIQTTLKHVEDSQKSQKDLPTKLLQLENSQNTFQTTLKKEEESQAKKVTDLENQLKVKLEQQEESQKKHVTDIGSQLKRMQEEEIRRHDIVFKEFNKSLLLINDRITEHGNRMDAMLKALVSGQGQRPDETTLTAPSPDESST